VASEAVEATGARRKGLLERVLGVFADVRAGEGGTALLLTLNVFLLLVSYYLLKVVREPLILLGGAFGLKGATLKAAAAAAQALLLLVVVPAYGLLANRVNRVRLITTVSGIFVACLAAFYLSARLELPVGLVFFIWLGIFNLMIVAQFWSFANDVYTEEEGKRLFAIVAFGGTSGAIVGSWLGGALIELISPYEIMLISAGLLLACAALTNVINRRTDAREKRESTQNKKSESGLSASGGFQLVLEKRYLLLIALMILVYNTVNTNGEFILGSIVSSEAEKRALQEVGTQLADAERAKAVKDEAGKIIGGFYGTFFTYVNVLTAVIQLFLVSRIFKWFGVRVALFVLPVVALGSYGAMLLAPALAVVRVGKILENSTDYSLQNTARQALFLPTTRDEKYKAKAAIDTFFVRFGDLASFGIVYGITTALAMSASGVAAANVALVLIWIALAVGIAQQHKKLSPDAHASPK
jgi:AAA family ATP:ADP antiporter